MRAITRGYSTLGVLVAVGLLGCGDDSGGADDGGDGDAGSVEDDGPGAEADADADGDAPAEAEADADAAGDAPAEAEADAGPDGDADADAEADALPWLAGVNLAGADFGEGHLPGTYGTDYIYPNATEVDYFVGKGMNVFRIPFRWERLQRTLNGELDATEAGRLDELVAAVVARGAYAILDPHNYARYHDDVVGSAAVPRPAYADFWRRLALVYAGEPHVIFGLMNEPRDMATEDWLAAANDAIAAIRAAGAGNLILVPGNAWTGAHSWAQNWYGTANAEVMLGVVDPAGRFAFEVHQYLDADFSGTSATCRSATIGSEVVADFTAWLRAHGFTGFLGEFAGGDNDTCNAAVDDLLDALEANDDVWLGWSWWAAGPWWGDYMFSLEPDGTTDRPQLGVLTPHL